MSRFSEINPSKKVSYSAKNFLFNDIQHFQFRRRKNFVKNWWRKFRDFEHVLLELTTFSEVGPRKKVDQYKIFFSTIYNTLNFRAKKYFEKNAHVSSHMTLETCLPWKVLSVVFTDHVCKVSYFCHDLHNAMPNSPH